MYRVHINSIWLQYNDSSFAAQFTFDEIRLAKCLVGLNAKFLNEVSNICMAE